MEASSGGKRRFRIAASLFVVFGLLIAAVFIQRMSDVPDAVQPAQTGGALPETSPVAAAQPGAGAPASNPQADIDPGIAEEDSPLEMRVPAFDIVRMDADGEGLVAGQAEPGAEVSVLVDGEKLAAAPADSAGRFAVFLTLAPSAETRIMSLLARLDGTEMHSSATVIINPSQAREPEPEEEPVVAEAAGSEAIETEATALLDRADEGAAATATEEAISDAGEAVAQVAEGDASAEESAPLDTSPSAPAPSPPTLSENAPPSLPEVSRTTSVAPTKDTDGAGEDQEAEVSSVHSEAANQESVAALDADATGNEAAGNDATGNDAFGSDVAATGFVPKEAGEEDTLAAREASPSTDEEISELDVAQTESTDRSPTAPQILLADEEGITVIQSPEAMSNVALDTISYDDEGDVSLGGRALGSGFVRVYLDDQPITTSRIEANGTWRTGLPDVDSGVYTLRVDEVGEDGEVTSRIETPFRREDPEVVAELATANSEPGAPVAAPLRQDVFTVQPGSTLWAIASANYGEGQLYVKVFEANRDRIRDPDLIYPGQVFDLPE
ncbi:MAG: LysM peptidoglycan-binding domain-containing protein [Pseudomonadota bacterium]